MIIYKRTLGGAGRSNEGAEESVVLVSPPCRRPPGSLGHGRACPCLGVKVLLGKVGRWGVGGES